MNSVLIQEDQCIGCALCVKDCPNAHLYLEKGRARAKENGCIECGHCYAICPKNAIWMANYDCADEPVVSMTELDSDVLLAAMKSRRSVRQFAPMPVEEDKIQKIMEAGRWCPTGGNSQNVAYTILGSRQSEAEKICVRLFRKAQKILSPFVPFLKRIEITDDFFFKGAPLVIAVSSSSNINAGLASSYMELMAENLGLGVLYSGFFVICTKVSRKLKRMLTLPKDHKVVACMVIGYTDAKYQRIPPRKPLQVKKL